MDGEKAESILKKYNLEEKAEREFASNSAVNLFFTNIVNYRRRNYLVKRFF